MQFGVINKVYFGKALDLLIANFNITKFKVYFEFNNNAFLSPEIS